MWLSGFSEKITALYLSHFLEKLMKVELILWSILCMLSATSMGTTSSEIRDREHNWEDFEEFELKEYVIV